MSNQTMRVVHCRRERYDTYIGRPSALGNSHPLGKPCPVPRCMGITHDRLGCIMAFYDDVRDSPALQAEILKLPDDAVLGCWCAPQACHGGVIKVLHPILKRGEPIPDWRSGALLLE